MRGSPDQSQSPVEKGAPTLPPLPDMMLRDDEKNESQILPERRSEEQHPIHNTSQQASTSGGPLQLPPLQFEMSRDHELPDIPPQLPRSLSPITEKSDLRHSHSGSGEAAAAHSNGQVKGSPERRQEENKSAASFFGEPIVTSPVTSSPPPASPQFDFRKRQSEDSSAAGSSSRSDSKLTSFTPPRQPTSPSVSHTKFESNSSYIQSADHGRQSPAPFAQQRQFNITPPPPIQAAAKPSSRPASPRPSPTPASQQSQFEFRHAPPSPQFSVLTSPHSIAEPQPPLSPTAVRRPGSRMSLMQDAFPITQNTTHPRPSTPGSAGMQSSFNTPTSQLAKSAYVPPSPPSPTPQALPLQQAASSASSKAPEPPLKDDPSPELLREAGALYYMRLERGEVGPRRQPPPPPPPADDKDDTTTSESGSAYSPTPAGTARSQGSWGPSRVTSPAATSPALGSVSTASSSYFPPQVQSRGGSSSGHGTAKPGGTLSPDPGVSPRTLRRPSGARDLPVSKTSAAAQREFQHSTTPTLLPPPSVDEDDEDDMSDDERNSEDRGPRLLPPRLAKAEAEGMHDNQHEAADMLAVLSYLEHDEAPASTHPKQSQSPPPVSPAPPVTHLVEPRAASPSPSTKSVRSSFAPSRKAEERKAKSQAQQAAHDAAVHKPGRANGRQKRKARDTGAWGESSEEEEEEDEDDEDADSDDEPKARSGRMDQRGFGSRPPPSGERGVSPGAPPREGSPSSQFRRPRDLPQVPGQGQGYPSMGPGLSPMRMCCLRLRYISLNVLSNSFGRPPCTSASSLRL